MTNIILPEAELPLATRRKTKIKNFMCRTKPTDGDYLNQKDHEKRKAAKRRFVGPCNTYDCHGLTFAARRTTIIDSIETILEEDDYFEIAAEDAGTGDVIIYWSKPNLLSGIAGYIQHSGIVLGRADSGVLRIWSKWGHGDEWVHNFDDCPYNSDDVRYYRLNDDPRAPARKLIRRRKLLYGG